MQVIILNIKLVAVDIDGTLVTNKKEILPETKNAIIRFIDNGGVFVIASGRPTKGIKRYIDELGLKQRGGYIISYNGSKITDIKTGKILSETNIDVKHIPSIISAAEKYDIPLTTYKDDIAITQKARDDFFNLEVTINKLEVKVVESLSDELNYPIPKFLITGEPEKLEIAEKHLREELTDLTVFRSEPFFLEIVPNGVNKGNSLIALSEELGIDRNETMACGDGFNDVTLIEAAGIGVAMENAQKPAKEVADFITRSNENNGVGYAIEKFCFK